MGKGGMDEDGPLKKKKERANVSGGYEEKRTRRKRGSTLTNPYPHKIND
jgi:hypothetical protein